MTNDLLTEPRCDECESVLPSHGAICHVCDVEAHFESVQRTAPPMFMHPSERAQLRRSDRRAS